MTFAIKSIVAATAFAAAGMASAASVTVPADTAYSGLSFSGSGSLSFSADLLGALDTGKVTVANYGAATTTVAKDTDGFYTQVSAAAPITALTIDSSSYAVLGAATTGGATQTAPVLKSVSSGGSLTVTDLNVDLANKKVYATIIGGNGVGTINNFALWNYSSIVGETKFTHAGDYVNDISGLTLTSDGFTKFSQSLGLLSLGKAAMQGITDYGTIHSTIHTVINPQDLVDPVPAIPEPSTYALMGLGLAGVALAARRRKAA